MKLYTYAFLCIFLLSASHAQSMDGFGLHNPRISREVGLSEQLASHEDAYKALGDMANGVVESIDTQSDPAFLQSMLTNLTTSQKKLIIDINATLQAINNASLDYNTVQVFMMNGFTLLKAVKELDFVLIESKIAALKQNVQPARPQQNQARSNGAQEKLQAEEARERQKRRQKTKPAEFLPLPRSIASKAVYHVKTKQVDEFCCGYNALYNACNLEEWCDFPNCYNEYTVFREACMGYLRHNYIDPKAAVNGETLKFLAENGLGLQQLFWIYVVNRNIKTPGQVTVKYEKGTSPAEIEDLFEATFESILDDLCIDTKKKLEKSVKSCEIVHFMCGIKSHGVGHLVLMSVIQNRTGRGLYIFDNINEPIDEASPAKLCIDFICERLAISEKSKFTGPYIPNEWPSISKR